MRREKQNIEIFSLSLLKILQVEIVVLFYRILISIVPQILFYDFLE